MHIHTYTQTNIHIHFHIHTHTYTQTFIHLHIHTHTPTIRIHRFYICEISSFMYYVYILFLCWYMCVRVCANIHITRLDSSRVHYLTFIYVRELIHMLYIYYVCMTYMRESSFICYVYFYYVCMTYM